MLSKCNLLWQILIEYTFKELISNIHKYSQTWANDHLRIMTTLPTATTIFWYRYFSFYNLKLPLNNQQQPLANNGYKIGVQWVVVVHRFDCAW